MHRRHGKESFDVDHSQRFARLKVKKLREEALASSSLTRGPKDKRNKWDDSDDDSDDYDDYDEYEDYSDYSDYDENEFDSYSAFQSLSGLRPPL